MPSPDGLQKKSTDVMTLPELNKNLDKTVKDIQNNYNGDLMVKLAIDASTLIKNRVIETGINAEGQKYSPYSTKPTLVGCKTFIQKSTCQTLLGSKSKRKELEWRTIGGNRLAILPGGYKKIRELQGRQTGFVDFSVTNRMWKNILVTKRTDPGLLSSDADHKNGIAIIGAREELEKKKLAGNTNRRGDILDLSKKEIDQLKKSYGLSVLNIFKENGL